MDENDEIQFQYPPGMDEYDFAYNYMLHRGYTQETIENWFEYDHDSHRFVPTKEYDERRETISRLDRKAINLYYEAAKVGLGELYLPNRVKILLEKKRKIKKYEAEQENVDEEDLHWRLSLKLYERGLASCAHRFFDDFFKYTLHGYEFGTEDVLYFHDEFLGIFLMTNILRALVFLGRNILMSYLKL